MQASSLGLKQTLHRKLSCKRKRNGDITLWLGSGSAINSKPGLEMPFVIDHCEMGLDVHPLTIQESSSSSIAAVDSSVCFGSSAVW